MSSTAEQLALDDNDKCGASERMNALRLAKEIYPRGPEVRLLEAAHLFDEFMKESRDIPYTSQLITTAFVEMGGLMPDDPAVITATARRLRDYVRTGPASGF